MLFSALLLPILRQPQTPLPRLRLIPGISEERLYTLDESLDGTRLITNAVIDNQYYSRAPRLWDAKRMKVLAVLAIPGVDAKPVIQTAISLDGRTVITAAQDGFRAWDSKTGNLLLNEKISGTTVLTGVGIAPDASGVVEATDDGRLVLWRMGQDKPTKELKLSNTLDGVGYSYGGKYILGLVNVGKESKDGGYVQAWRSDDLEPIQTFPVIKEGIRNVNFGRDDATIVISDMKGKVHVYDTATANHLFDAEYVTAGIAVDVGLDKSLQQDGERANARFAGRDHSLLLTPQKDGGLNLLDSKTGVVKDRLVGAKGLLRDLRTSIDGIYVAVVGGDGGLKVWNLETRAAVPITIPKEDKVTALEFSRDSKALWIGSSKGHLVRYDLVGGLAVREASSATEALAGVRVFKNGTFALERELQRDNGTKESLYQVFHPQNTNSIIGYVPTTDQPPIFSPDGKRAVILHPYGDKGGSLIDLTQFHKEKTYRTFPSLTGAVWERRGAWVAGFFDDGVYAIFDGATNKRTSAGRLASSGNLRGSDVSPNGKMVATCGLVMPNRDPKRPKAEWTGIWDPKTGQVPSILTTTTDKEPQCRFAADKNLVAVKDECYVEVFSLLAAKRIAYFKIIDHYTDPNKGYNEQIVDIQFSADGKTVIAHAVDGALYRLDIATQTIDLIKGDASHRRRDNWVVSGDGKTGLNFTFKGVDVWDLPTKKIVAHMNVTDDVTSVALTPDEKRVLTTDPVDGMVVWDFADRTAPKRLGALIFGQGKEVLTIDADGRFDATDPSQVSSASYVFAWSGGLEPVDMAQMKSRFYEPGLFASLMGLSAEPRRAVPDVASLHLYPSVKLSSKGGKIGVEVEDRDDGGVGAVELFVNGKMVQRKNGGGYFTFDPGLYRSYLIPTSKLRPGERNELRVVAGNEENDLKSPPEVAEIPLPDDLKAPPTRLIALCVGAGNYLGEVGDLKSPPSDANAIGDALRKVSKRLLPAGVDVTVLTTDSKVPAERPSRARILQWFSDTAKTATASDIVMVFIAGHGTNKIGEVSDYFFLTPDCDPSDVSSATVGVATISGDDLRTALAKIPASKQVVVLDTCHSGAASKSLLVSSRSVAGDYGRAYESIREASGTWVLAGAASDQLSYEASSVDHGMLTYALLEAIDKASPEGLRKSESGDLFVDVEGWLTYAVGRVESLKNELDLPGVQQPELRSSTAGGSFDIGVTSPANRGELGLHAPRPVVIVGGFSNANDEDPLHLEKVVGASLTDSKRVKPWFEVSSHPGAFRVAGSYTVTNGAVSLKLLIQKFDAAGDRKTIRSVVLAGSKADPTALAAKIRMAVENEIAPGAKAPGS